MSADRERCARKDCHVVIGCGQYDYSDYLVGHDISLSRAKKAAHNKAHTANGDPTSFSDVFLVYDAAVECRYRITFNELLEHLRHPGCPPGHASGLAASPVYLRPRDRQDNTRTAGVAAAVMGKGLFDNMELSAQGKAEYAQMRKQFNQDRPGKDCRQMIQEICELRKHMYEHDLQSPTFLNENQ